MVTSCWSMYSFYASRSSETYVEQCGKVLDGHDVLYKGFIVDAAVGVFLSCQKGFYFFLLHLLTQCGQHVTKLSTHNCAIAFLVKDTQTLNKVLKGALVLVVGNSLQHRQELVKLNLLGIHLLIRWVAKDFLDLSICGVLSKSSHDISNLAVGDFAFTCPVKEQESLFEVFLLILTELDLSKKKISHKNY